MLAPKSLAVTADGGFDLIVHLNGAQMTEAEWRSAGVNAVIASIAIPTIVGTGGYKARLAQPGFLDYVLKETVHWMHENKHAEAKKINRIAVVSWSAGFGGVARFLISPTTRDRVDAIMLLDSFHAGYADPNTHLPKQGGETTPFIGLGEEFVDVSGMDRWKNFAEGAKNRQKLFVISHSSILPPDYASCGETTGALLKLVSVPKVASSERNDKNMELSYTADVGEFHAKGWRGRGKKDHFDQLHLVGDLARAYLAPRWHHASANTAPVAMAATSQEK
jgi:hypothetical protein